MRFLVVKGRAEQDWTEEGIELLKEHGQVEVVAFDPTDEQSFLNFCKLSTEVDGILVSPWFHLWNSHKEYIPGFWSRAKHVKALGGTFDNRFEGWLDYKEVASSGIQMIDTSRSMTTTVAEFALAMMLNLVRHIPASIDLVRTGGWRKTQWVNPNMVYGDLSGRRVGLAGFGSINRRLAELLSPFHCEVRTYDPFVDDAKLKKYDVQSETSLESLARFSEIFVVGIPPTPTTLNIVNKDVLSSLSKGALFVLLTRMQVVEQEILWSRVQARELYAAVDVFAPEPPPEDAWFRNHPNVIPTPHIAGGSHFSHRRCFLDACKDVIEVLRGGEPRYLATPRDHNFYNGRQ
jgi:phosphoglycerate dehydrogenase-like enzyme